MQNNDRWPTRNSAASEMYDVPFQRAWSCILAALDCCADEGGGAAIAAMQITNRYNSGGKWMGFIWMPKSVIKSTCEILARCWFFLFSPLDPPSEDACIKYPLQNQGQVRPDGCRWDQYRSASSRMVLYLVGLGLYDEKDITLRWGLGCGGWRHGRRDWPCSLVNVIKGTHAIISMHDRGLEAVRKCSRVYLEAYTSILLCDKSRLVSEGFLFCRATPERKPW